MSGGKCVSSTPCKQSTGPSPTSNKVLDPSCSWRATPLKAPAATRPLNTFPLKVATWETATSAGVDAEEDTTLRVPRGTSRGELVIVAPP